MGKLRVLLLSILLRLVSFLPLVIIQQLGSLLGVTLWYSSSKMAKITRENIDLCFPGLSRREQHKLARLSLEETGKSILETAHAWMAPIDLCLSEFVSVEGEAFVQQAVSDQRGLIFVIPHLGNWEMLNLYLGVHYPLTHMYQPSDPPDLSHAILNYRQRSGTEFVSVSMAGIRSQLVALKAGNNIGAMPDQEPAQPGGVFANYFGQSAITSTLLPRLYQGTGARMIVAYAQRLPRGKGFKIVFQSLQPRESVAKVSSVSGTDAAIIDPQALNDGIQLAVASLPEQYLWSYKRFRTRPEGEPEYYQLKGHPLSVLIQTALLKLLLWLFSLPTLSIIQKTGEVLGILGWHLKTAAAKVTRINIDLCLHSSGVAQRQALCRNSMVESGKTLMETGRIWLSSDTECQRLYSEIRGEDLLMQARSLQQGVVVLIPPQGNRELTIRYLGSHFNVTEYYHPDKNTALDELIRQMRNRMGIALLPHINKSVELMIEKLKMGELVTLCPDQQPRLRGGLFVPFFGIDALTTRILPTLLQQSNARLICATTERLRKAGGFRLLFEELDCSLETDEEMLQSINLGLQYCIETNLDQYRWSDKRFNIRPKGQPKLYKF